MRILIFIFFIAITLINNSHAVGTGSPVDVARRIGVLGVRTFASKPPFASNDARRFARRILPKSTQSHKAVLEEGTPWESFSKEAEKLPGYDRVKKEGESFRKQGWLPEKIFLRHVGVRDGLQGESSVIPSDEAAAMYESLYEAGFQEIEATSWLTKLPSMGDFRGIRSTLRDQSRSATYLTMRRAAAEDFFQISPLPGDSIAVVLGTTEGFNKKNTGLGTSELMTEIGQVLTLATTYNVPVTGYLSKAFGMRHSLIVATMLKDMQDAGITRIIPSDTDGLATPKDIIALMTLAQDFRVIPQRLSLHLHRGNTPLGELSNILAYLACGGTYVDVGFHDESVGGCPRSDRPMMPNVSDMFLVKLMSDLGIKTGINPDALWSANQVQQNFIKALRKENASPRAHL